MRLELQFARHVGWELTRPKVGNQFAQIVMKFMLERPLFFKVQHVPISVSVQQVHFF
jgi:hypothetical protein